MSIRSVFFISYYLDISSLSTHDCDGSRQRPGTALPQGTALARVWGRILVQVTIYRRLLIGRDGHRRLCAFSQVFSYYFDDHSERLPCLITSHYRGTAVPPRYRGTTKQV